MSEAISGAIAGAATGACVAAAGLVISAARVTYKACTWLSEKACDEMERLERVLDEPLPDYTTPIEAQSAYFEKLEKAKTLVEKSPILAPQAAQMAQLMALKHSTLSSFVDAKSWNDFIALTGKNNFENLISRSIKNFRQSHTMYIVKSIIEVAGAAGFTDVQQKECKRNRHVLVLKDKHGRSVVSHVLESDSRAQLTLDLTGFGNNSCHAVMDQLLTGLAQKQISLDGITRKSHYNRKGILQNTSQKNKLCKLGSTGTKKTKNANGRRRRGLAMRCTTTKSQG
ncbi:MAG: hypothetical protein DWQ10_10910 [Calditrichaeota bacterium]|nr:MAG: hypothetical protein DWQ10_10910 [Calditrichota bacterium]